MSGNPGGEMYAEGRVTPNISTNSQGASNGTDFDRPQSILPNFYNKVVDKLNSQIYFYRLNRNEGASYVIPSQVKEKHRVFYKPLR